jgi:hypothetical protein
MRRKNIEDRKLVSSGHEKGEKRGGEDEKQRQ